MIGCGVTHISLAPRVPKPIKPAADGGMVAVSPGASGLPATIGHGTVSLFAIPVTPVRFGDSDTAQRIMNDVRTCLRAAGYEPTTAAEPPAGPVLFCTIEDFDFSNYTWLWPMVRTWGTIRMTLTLSEPSGAVRWQKQYEERYGHTGVSSSFNQAVNSTMSEILARVTEDFAGPEFRAACCAARPVAGGSAP